MTVSMICPSDSTTSIVRAKPTSSAAAVMSAAPRMKARLVSPGLIRAMAAPARPIPRNTAFNSAMYQPLVFAP